MIYHIISHITYHLISYHIISYIISYHISYHIISYIISYHIISYIISFELQMPTEQRIFFHAIEHSETRIIAYFENEDGPGIPPVKFERRRTESKYFSGLRFVPLVIFVECRTVELVLEQPILPTNFIFGMLCSLAFTLLLRPHEKNFSGDR